MSAQKTKEFGKMLFKEGSVSIATFGITSYLILSNFSDNPFVYDLFLYSYYIGLFLTLVIIFFRIGLNQYVIARLKLSKLGDDLKAKDYSALKEDTLDKVLKPLVTDVAKDVADLLKKKEPEKTPENNVKDAVKKIEENLPLIEPEPEPEQYDPTLRLNIESLIKEPEPEPEYLEGAEPEEYANGD